MNGIERIKAERERQINKEGWTTDHDAGHRYGELAMNAAALAVWGTEAEVIVSETEHELGEKYDPWGLVGKHKGNEIRCLEIAGALIAAEIDRLQRTEGGG